MGRKPSKPKDPTYAAIEAMVAQSGLNATTQEEVVNYSKLFMKAFLERAMQGARHSEADLHDERH